VTRSEPTTVEGFLQSLVSQHDVRSAARHVGCVQRQRKIDAYALLLSVVLGVSTRGSQTLASIRRALELKTGIRVVRSAFWDRMTPQLEALVDWLLDLLMHNATAHPPEYQGVLSGFRDVIAVDATVIKVADELRSTWRGTRSNSRPAALKVHTWVRALTGELLKYRITPETYGDNRAFGVSHQERGALFLFDRGYCSPTLWHHVHRVGAYFLTPLPTDYDPVIQVEHRQHRGRARTLKDRKLHQALKGLKRTVVDVSAVFRIYVRKYRSRTGHNRQHLFRVVAIRNPNTGHYSCYVTNVPSERLPAEYIRNAYRLRWEGETYYKSAKSGSGMNELPSTKPHIVRTLVKAALIRTGASAERGQW
jgi:putative transposase